MVYPSPFACEIYFLCSAGRESILVASFSMAIDVDRDGIFGASVPVSLESLLAQALWPLNNRVEVYGDSRAWYSFDANGASSEGVPFWLEGLTKGRVELYPALNFGVGGENTNQIRARLSQPVNSGAGITVCVMGVNDATLADYVNLSEEQSVENINYIDDQLAQAGKLRLWVAETPKSPPAAAFTTRQLMHHYRIAEAIRRLRGKPGVVVSDPWSLVSDYATGAWKAGMSWDGLHWAAGAAFQIAKPFAAYLNQVLPATSWAGSSALDLYASGNPLGVLPVNPFFTGTAGTFGTASSGSLGDGWRVQSSEAGLTAVASKTTLNGQSAQRVVVSGPVTGSAGLIEIRRGLATTDYEPGSIIRMSADFKVAAGHTGLLSCALMFDQATGVDPSTGANSSSHPSIPGGEEFDLTITTEPLVIADPEPSLITLKLMPGFKNGETASATIDIRNISVKRVG